MISGPIVGGGGGRGCGCSSHLDARPKAVGARLHRRVRPRSTQAVCASSALPGLAWGGLRACPQPRGLLVRSHHHTRRASEALSKRSRATLAVALLGGVQRRVRLGRAPMGDGRCDAGTIALQATSGAGPPDAQTPGDAIKRPRGVATDTETSMLPEVFRKRHVRSKIR